jgi:tetratricopeptide (TPR) repeat protein
VPGAAVVLVSDRGASLSVPAPATTERVAAGAREWLDSCGKTQLAIWLATSLREAGTVEVVIWVPATSRASVLSGYAEAAAALGLLPPGGDSREDAEAVAARLLVWLHGTATPWLVVLDDLTEAAALDRLWPAGPAGRVLVTATSAAAVSSHQQAEPVIVPVGTFSRREAVSYMVGRLTEDLDQRQGVADLAAELGDEPLALVLAGSTIAVSELTCRSYLEALTARRDKAREEPGPPALAAAALTWAVSVEQADQLAGPIAHAQLTFAALLDGNGIPVPVFIEAGRIPAVPADALHEGLAALEALGLISIDRTTLPPLVRVNWVVQAAARAATTGAAIGPAASAAADGMLAAWPEDDQPEWLARAFRSNAQALRRIAGDALWHGGCHPLLMRAGRSLGAMRASRVAAEYWGELAAVSDRLLGSEHPDTLAISERLARAYLAAGQPAEAISWFQWIRGDRVSRLGQYDIATADASGDLGRALLAAGRCAEAASMLAEAALAYSRTLGPESTPALDTRDDLVGALRASGELSKAIGLGKRVLDERERIQGDQHPDVLAAAARLADAYLAAGQDKAAISLLRRAASGRERVLGPRDPDTIATRAALASAYHAAGKMASAVQLYEQVRADYTQVLGGEHRLTLAASLNLARALAEVGRQTDAVKMLRETAERCELHLPAGDPLTVTASETLQDLAGEAPSLAGRQGTSR